MSPESSKKSRISRFFRKAWLTVKKYTQIREDTDYEATVESISKSVVFRGVNVWILFFAIIIASVGLNVNATAVIIGAMLISPLMGPINGLGLAVGTFDDELLKQSLKNLAIMVGISLIASTLYFLISPLSHARSELLARTQPTIFDVFIAFFGGLAGIVATSRKSQSITIISGVAIATALMPPLCTAGYGIATGQIWYFLGAFYLFFINSFFIALATFIMVRYLHFPQKKYVDENRNRTVKRIITIFTLIILVPSIYLAGDVVKEAAFKAQSAKFINDFQTNEDFQNIQVVASECDYHHRSQSVSLSLIGRPLSHSEINDLQKSLQIAYGQKKAKLIIRQTGEAIDITQQNEIIEDILDKKDNALAQKDSTIADLRTKINKIQNAETLSVQLTKEIYAQYPNVKKFAITDLVQYDTKTLENNTIAVVYLQWKEGDHAAEEQKLIQWLRVRLGVENLKVIH
ncbi:MAG: DUF389 domain-containing protein [Bacteroidales bacterium]|nr:DUF389 domain-containing protein [Bacteroidales bacterium]